MKSLYEGDTRNRWQKLYDEKYRPVIEGKKPSFFASKVAKKKLKELIESFPEGHNKQRLKEIERERREEERKRKAQSRVEKKAQKKLDHITRINQAMRGQQENILEDKSLEEWKEIAKHGKSKKERDLAQKIIKAYQIKTEAWAEQVWNEKEETIEAPKPIWEDIYTEPLKQGESLEQKQGWGRYKCAFCDMHTPHRDKRETINYDYISRTCQICGAIRTDHKI